jgi:PHD/YefM family antitoxin component YafN of YafNO toxin-antitoxin module
MKNTQEFFQLGVTKPSMSDVQNYLNGLGTRLMQLSDIKKKIINHFKNIKKLQLDPFGRKVLSFEEVVIENHEKEGVYMDKKSYNQFMKEAEEDFVDMENLDEKLSPSQRRKMALRMRIQARKPAFIMKRKRMMKRAANKQTLQRRARKAAIKTVVKKFYPKLRGKKTSDLSYAERGKISDIVKKKAAIITRFAKRMIKDVRKKDVERRKSMNKNKNKK